MQISNKIDQLITDLKNLKPNLINDTVDNKEKFNSLLKAAIETDYLGEKKSLEHYIEPEKKVSKKTPSWVGSNYYYDPENPRKPNMYELMMAISGKKPEELYAESNSNWRKISSQASEILYGVVGSNADTRDWSSIMSSDNVVKAAQVQTGKMYEPMVDIISQVNSEKQIAVIKNKEGTVLRSLSDDVSKTEEILNNFGASNNSIPTNIETKVNVTNFNSDLLNYLKNFGQQDSSVEKLVFQTAAEAISKKLSNEIPSDELAKL